VDQSDRKARFVAPEMPAPKMPTSKEFPFRLNTGRVRDQWRTITRSGLSARLGAHLLSRSSKEHPTDAKAMELIDGGFARVDPLGACVLKVIVSDRQRRGSLFAPIHWSNATGGPASAGLIVCGCFGVGLLAIRAAIRSGTVTSVEGIGKALRAGTNCGSCLPELKRIVADTGAATSPAATTSRAKTLVE
jgi:bacterioferritin-associated ferredoxin